MSDFSHLICFYPGLPHWSTGPQNWDITFPTFLAIPSTRAPLFIKVLSAPGVHPQLGSDFSDPPSFLGAGFWEGCERLLPWQFYNWVVIKNRNGDTRLSWEKICPRLEIQRPLYLLLRFVFFPVCVMANANESCVSSPFGHFYLEVIENSPPTSTIYGQNPGVN